MPPRSAMLLWPESLKIWRSKGEGLRSGIVFAAMDSEFPMTDEGLCFVYLGYVCLCLDEHSLTLYNVELVHTPNRHDLRNWRRKSGRLSFELRG